MTVKVEPEIPGPNAADNKLPDADRERGVRVMDKRWGYRMMVDNKGLLLPPVADASACDDLRNRFELKAHDVVVTTYPKCGTTWMQQIVCLLMLGSDTPVNPMQDAKWLEVSASLAANGMKLSSPPLSVDGMLELPKPGAESGGLRAWKTHSPVGCAPWKGGVEGAHEVGAKIVIVSRNPKDTAVSKYHHTKKLAATLHFDGEWEQFAPLFLAGTVSHNSFWDWHRDWWIAKEKYPETILWLQYEDMKKDLKTEITKIAKFLGLERSDEELDKVVDRCTFSSMKAEAKARDDIAHKKNHFRSGKSGGWVDVMSSDTVAKFDSKTEKLYSECSLRFHDK